MEVFVKIFVVLCRDAVKTFFSSLNLTIDQVYGMADNGNITRTETVLKMLHNVLIEFFIFNICNTIFFKINPCIHYSYLCARISLQHNSRKNYKLWLICKCKSQNVASRIVVKNIITKIKIEINECIKNDKIKTKL